MAVCADRMRTGSRSVGAGVPVVLFLELMVMLMGFFFCAGLYERGKETGGGFIGWIFYTNGTHRTEEYIQTFLPHMEYQSKTTNKKTEKQNYQAKQRFSTRIKPKSFWIHQYNL